MIKEPIFGLRIKKIIMKKTTQGVGTSFNKYIKGDKKSFTGLNNPATRPKEKAKIKDIIKAKTVLKKDSQSAV